MNLCHIPGCALLVLCLAPPGLAGNRFEVKLELSQGAVREAVTNGSPSPRLVARPRPVFHAEANETLTLHWVLRAEGDTSLADVLVHFYVARLDGSGQLPDLKNPDNVLLEGALTMDFKEGNSAQSSMRFRVPKPGRYMVRVEAQHDDLSPLAESFAAMDLEAK